MVSRFRRIRSSSDSIALPSEFSFNTVILRLITEGYRIGRQTHNHCIRNCPFRFRIAALQNQRWVYRDPTENGRIVSPTLMWIEALDLLLEKLKTKVDYAKVAAISGSGQQHGSVYWKKGSEAILASLDPNKKLLPQFSDAFSTLESPIWMDSSTTQQCREIEKAVGGALELSKLTGSTAHERYTGPQIRKMYEKKRTIYDDTERISLRAWSKIALEATAPDLEEKLGKLAPAHAVAGLIAPYFVERYKFKKDCVIVQWSGDNPNSLAGLTLNTPGDLAISLGTSDTVFGITSVAQPSLEGHIFPNPVDPNCYMVMLCYKNGSLTREDVRNRCAEKSWDVFCECLEKTPPLNGGKLGFFYKEHEILPPLPVGFHRYILENFSTGSLDNIKEREVEEFDPPSEVRAIVEGQFLSMRGHAERFGMRTPPKRIIATGGASSNQSILKSMAMIFGCPVYTVQRPDSASLGAALRAAHGKLDKTSLGAKLAVPAGEKEEDKDLLEKYSLVVRKRMEIEKRLVEKLGRV
uniref:Xylulose kinase n=1 Tax=Ananas comosus var. bracteatus TaxID=296719 RepID=A0A6V7PBF1_ANACO|nr:unnamed protein product [Ananas comosus var. bracteatus]